MMELGLEDGDIITWSIATGGGGGARSGDGGDGGDTTISALGNA